MNIITAMRLSQQRDRVACHAMLATQAKDHAEAMGHEPATPMAEASYAYAKACHLVADGLLAQAKDKLAAMVAASEEEAA